MTEKEVLIRLCSIVALVYRSIGDYSHASDGFCSNCKVSLPIGWRFEHDGETIEYIRKAVVEKLKRDGIKIHKGWDMNGKEKKDGDGS